MQCISHAGLRRRAITAALLSMTACRVERAKEREPAADPTSGARGPAPEPAFDGRSGELGVDPRDRVTITLKD